MKITKSAEAEQRLRELMQENSVRLVALERRDYPEESIFIARVEQSDMDRAVGVGNQLDREFYSSGYRGLVTVRPAEAIQRKQNKTLTRGVGESQSADFANLLVSRARTSEVQPSLAYVPDSDNNLAKVTARRHHLIFGRRGAGKTALMLEAKRLLEEQGHLRLWLNMQTYRREAAERAFLWFASNVCELVLGTYKDRPRPPAAYGSAANLMSTIQSLLLRSGAVAADASSLVPNLRDLIKRLLQSEGKALHIFIDDLHYLDRNQQPQFLDLVHGSIRDIDAWLKVATIKHLSRWFIASPPTGLQTGHDAHLIDLDVSLQDPTKAKAFLETVLRSYSTHAGIGHLSQIFGSESLDRLVLASGGVPRDYMELSAGSIREAQRRPKAKLVGVQDVNKAAGEAATVKITELEEDAASAPTETSGIIQALQVIREFCLDLKKYTFFRVDYRDKEKQLAEYSVMQSLMDLRLVHLINPSVSDQHEAGKRSEVFMLDLSQFSGQRLKKNLHVLDFVSGQLVMKKTGTTKKVKVGNTPKKLLELLRRGPVLELKLLGFH